jgi:hypothetical protein
MKRAKFAVFILSLTCLGATIAVAGEITEAKIKLACNADREKFCAGDKSGQGSLVGCLRKHAPQLGDTCIAAMRAARDARDDAQAACRPDIHKFCADIKGDEGRTAACLHQHADQIEETCRLALGVNAEKYDE